MSHERAVELAEGVLGGGPIWGGDVERAIRVYLESRAGKTSLPLEPHETCDTCAALHLLVDFKEGI